MVAEEGAFTRREGDVDVVVEDAEGEGQLRQLAVAHHHVGLEVALRRAHAGEVDAVARLPVVTAQVLQVERHHRHVGAPLLESDEHAHADFVDAGLPHAVEAVDAPLELRLHAGRVVDVVVGAVVGLLEADHAVESRVGQPLVLLGGQRHHLDGQVVEVGAADLQRLLDVVDSRRTGILARDQQQVLEGAEAADGTALLLNLFGGENHARNGVVAVEAAVDARIGARVGDVHRDVHRDGLAETLLRIAAAQAGHRLEVGGRRRRDECHEVVEREVFTPESRLDVGRAFGLDATCGLLPVVFG